MVSHRTRGWQGSSTKVHGRLAESVRETRLAAGLTQADLAERAGLERKTISRIENQHLSPTIDTLVRIALVLRCDVAELIDGA